MNLSQTFTFEDNILNFFLERGGDILSLKHGYISELSIFLEFLMPTTSQRSNFFLHVLTTLPIFAKNLLKTWENVVPNIFVEFSNVRLLCIISSQKP